MLSRREQQVLDRIRKAVYERPKYSGWTGPGVPYASVVKGTSMIKFKGGEPFRKLLGCSRAEFALLQPLIVQWIGLVYQGDVLFETAQAEGRSKADNSWTEAMRELIRGHGVYEPAIGEVIDELERYYTLEGQILLGEVELTDEVLADVMRIRSIDYFGLLRAVTAIRGEQYNEDYAALLRPLWLLGEINDDLASYAKDVEKNSFNTLRLMVWRHGVDGAVAGLRRIQRQAIEDALAVLRTADRETLVKATSTSELLPLEHVAGLIRLLPTEVLRSLASTLMRLELGTILKDPVPTPIAEPGPLAKVG